MSKFMQMPWTSAMGAPCTFARWEADGDGNVVEEVVIVKTDIDAPTATPFAEVRSMIWTPVTPMTAEGRRQPCPSTSKTTGPILGSMMMRRRGITAEDQRVQVNSD